ncbi:MAG: hypothetical protein M0Z43_11265 [Acidithiobacillus sp.]|nr:hypothetical protein [Acidithiobacillus sp.]
MSYTKAWSALRNIWYGLQLDDNDNLKVTPAGHGDGDKDLVYNAIAASVALADAPTIDLGGYEGLIEGREASDGVWVLAAYFATAHVDGTAPTTDDFIVPQVLRSLGYSGDGWTPYTIPGVSNAAPLSVEIPRHARYARIVPMLSSGATPAMSLWLARRT